MKTTLAEPVVYHLQLGDDTIAMNELVGQKIHLKYEGQINCKICGDKTKKAFGEGFCYRHFMSHPANSPCIIRPELCEGHLGIGRDPEWELANHVQPHVVYLAIASGVKVGVTRQQQVPTRWIDQGAWKAVRLAETENRQQAGLIEVALKDHISDKTHWQKMLKNILAEDLDILDEKDRMAEFVPEELEDFITDNNEITEITYPVQAFPEKVKSQKLDKVPEIEGTLMGIKGQYLILDEGRVMNVRSHTGYFVELTV
ncbi:MAG: DUF2797 domain-containing protein [Bacteroidota bacterium]